MLSAGHAIRRCVAAAASAAALAALAFAPSCAQGPTVVQLPSDVATPVGGIRLARVLLLEGVRSAALSVYAPYAVEPWGPRARGTPTVLAQCPPLAGGEVRATPSALIIGDRHFPDQQVLLNIQAPAALALNGQRYRGNLLVRRAGEELVSLINVLHVEDYLYGVLGGETFPAWPPAALEAQAIVARSYTLWRMAQRRDEPFDLYATVMDQNYLGMAKEDPRLRAAVDRTAGMVLLYQMNLFRCYYHSTCGGHTEAVQEVFPDPPLLPLGGVPCRFCKDSPHFSWQRGISEAQLADAVGRRWPSIRPLASLAVTRQTATGRAAELLLSAGPGRQATVAASDFRLAVGASKLPSTFFEVRATGGGYTFTGRGFGHGVGMCQWGARGMAQAGYSAIEILRHYYPGAQLTRLYERPP